MRPVPKHARHSGFAQELIGQPEVAATDETAMGRERAGMGGAQHMVARPVDEAPFLLGMSAPQQEDDSLAMGIDPLDDPIGKGLPPQVGVRVRHTRLYR